MARNSDHIVIRPDTAIGNISAEADDEFLFECFVDHPALSSLRRDDSTRVILIGRTGAGKTAFIRKIERVEKANSIIELHSMALDYVTNSDIVAFLRALDVDLDLFFQALWKHVLCIEYIRMRYGIDSEKKSKDIFSRIVDFFKKDERKARAIDYLQKWENKFWITMDENIREITTRLESSVDTELSAEIDKFKSRAGYARTLSNERKSQLQARAKKIVNASLLTDLSRVVDLIAEFDKDDKYRSKCYILIDKIDEKWVDESLRFSLVRSLIECIKSFFRVTSARVVVAIRSDVLERVIQETEDVGFQREKYDDYFLKIVWQKEQLKEIIEKRINFLYRRKYTSSNVFFNDIFRNKVGSKDPFDYMLERTLYRPRDIISFVNICLIKAQGKTEVSAKTVLEAESEYSRIRLQALVQEWESAFPSLKVAFRLLSGRRGRFQPSDITTRVYRGVYFAS